MHALHRRSSRPLLLPARLYSLSCQAIVVENNAASGEDVRRALSVSASTRKILQPVMPEPDDDASKRLAARRAEAKAAAEAMEEKRLAQEKKERRAAMAAASGMPSADGTSTPSTSRLHFHRHQLMSSRCDATVATRPSFPVALSKADTMFTRRR